MTAIRQEMAARTSSTDNDSRTFVLRECGEGEGDQELRTDLGRHLRTAMFRHYEKCEARIAELFRRAGLNAYDCIGSSHAFEIESAGDPGVPIRLRAFGNTIAELPVEWEPAE